MSIPYELYVRFLVTKGYDDIKDVCAALDDLNLPHVPQTVLNAQANLVTAALPRPVQDQIESQQYMGDFLQWMKVLEVQELWFGEKPFSEKNREAKSRVKLACDINQDLQVRLVLNSLLMKGIKGQDIVQTINIRFATLLKPEHVALYQKFFWEPARMTRKAWKDFLGKCEAREQFIYFTALTEPVDVLKTELELPAKVSSAETLQYLLTKSYQKAKQFLAVGTPEANKEAREWIDATLKLIDKYEKHRSGDMEDFGNALQMAFDFVDAEFETPDPEVLKEISSKLKKEADERAAGEKKDEGEGGG